MQKKKQSARLLQAGLTAVLLVLVVAASGSAAIDHSFLTSYEGSKTCRQCHEGAVDEMTQALHYKLLGPVQGVFDYFTNKPITGEHGKGDRY
jgi:hypothetical protein